MSQFKDNLVWILSNKQTLLSFQGSLGGLLDMLLLPTVELPSKTLACASIPFVRFFFQDRSPEICYLV